MSNQLIRLPDLPHPSALTANEAAIAELKELVEVARGVESVAGESSQRAAVKVLQDLQELLKAVEAQRKALKDPVLKLGKRIDAIIEEAVAEPEKEKERLKKLIAVFQAEQIRKQQEAQRELERLAEERRQAELKGDDQAVAKVDQQAMQAVMEVPAQAKPSGLSVTYVWVINIQDINALYRTFPNLCKPPEPRIREIQSALSQMEALGQEPKLPGLTATKEIDTRIRS